MIRKYAKTNGLSDIEVLIEESGTSFYFNVGGIPDVLQVGKTSFFLDPYPNILKPSTEIKIDLVDVNGNPIYVEYPRDRTISKYVHGYTLPNSTGRLVSINVYPETPSGYADLVIVGEAEVMVDDSFIGGEEQVLNIANDESRLGEYSKSVPSDWQGVYNVRWKKRVFIDSSLRNSSKVVFYQTPSVNVSEIQKQYQMQYYTDNDALSLIGTSPSSSYYVSYAYNKLAGTFLPKVPIPLNVPQKRPELLSGGEGGEGGEGNDGYVDATTPQHQPVPSINFEQGPIITAHGFEFTYDMNGATINIPTPSVNQAVLDTINGGGEGGPVEAGFLNTRIEEVINSNTARIRDIYTASFTDDSEDMIQTRLELGLDYIQQIESFGQSDFTLQWNTPATYSVSEHFQSYAKVDVANLRTLSGEIDRIQLFMKSSGSIGDWKLISDKTLDTVNVLVEPTADENSYNIGRFNTYTDGNNIFDTYWATSSFDLSTNAESLTQPTITLGNITFMEGVDIDSNAGLGGSLYQSIFPNRSSSFYSDDEPKLSFTLIRRSGDGQLDVYMSGSSFDGTTTPLYNDNQANISSIFYDALHSTLSSRQESYRDKFGKLLFSTTATENGYKNFGRLEIPFVVDNDGVGYPVFAVRGGEWTISNVRLEYESEPGYHPDFYTFTAYVPAEQEQDQLSFRLKYYTPENVESSLVSELSLKTKFIGNSHYIYGTRNLISGSTYIGNSLHSGVEITSGVSGSGTYLRSIGYEGYEEGSNEDKPGFMIYSGTVLPGSSNNYDGVGIELVGSGDGGYKGMRFRSDLGRMEVTGALFATEGHFDDNFSVGTGSGEQRIEISASYNSGSIGDLSIIKSAGWGQPIDSGWAVLGDGRAYFTNVFISGTVSASFGSIGGFTISPSALYSPATTPTIVISGSPSVGGVDSPEYMFISSSYFNVKQNGDITGSSVLFTGGTIGGFTITDTDITSNNLILDSGGTIQTADFTPDLKGWIISSVGNGYMEVENAKIRGTLRTIVFEKETINAVGGQLWVANSTVMSSSVSDSETTWSVDNVGGFISEEILLVKKTGDTGFSSEYVMVDSASVDPTGDGLVGNLYVTRSYNVGLESLDYFNFTASAADSYEEGQVIVSTGKSPDTGWIRLNANPNDPTTPYMDMVERTGSGVFDYELRSRLGDLSGLANTNYVFGNSDPGFGLATDNVFLQGGIIASFGSIGGWRIDSQAITSSNVVISSSEGGAFKMGATIPTSLTSDGIYLSGSGEFNLQSDADNYIRLSAGVFGVKAKVFDLDADTIIIDNALNNGYIALGATPNTSVSGTSPGVYMDGTGDFLAYEDANNYLKMDGGALSILSDTFTLAAGGLSISANGSAGTIDVGTLADEMDIGDASTGVYINDSGEFLAKSGASGSGYIQSVGGNVTIKSDVFTLEAGNLRIDSVGEHIKFDGGSVDFGSGTGVIIGSDGGTYEFYAGDGSNYIWWDGTNLTLTGGVTASSGDIGGWLIGNEALYKNNVYLSSSEGGVLKLGSTVPTSVTDGDGIVLSGSGEVLFGDSYGERFQRVEVDGAYQLIMSSSTFLFGVDQTGTDAYISGSGGKLEISSSNFYLNDVGVFLSGTISSSAGVIGSTFIDTGSLTGGTIQTAVTGKRIKIEGSDNTLRFFSGSAGVEVMLLDDNLEYTFRDFLDLTDYSGSEAGIRLQNGIFESISGESDAGYIGFRSHLSADSADTANSYKGFVVANDNLTGLSPKREGGFSGYYLSIYNVPDTPASEPHYGYFGYLVSEVQGGGVYGGYFQSKNIGTGPSYGVYANGAKVNPETGNSYGGYFDGSTSTSGEKSYGVYGAGSAWGSDRTTKAYGVYGKTVAVTTTEETYAIYGEPAGPFDDIGGGRNYAGYFSGSIYVLNTVSGSEGIFGAIYETKLQNESIPTYPQGTLLVWNGEKLVPSEYKEDPTVMGVSSGKRIQPIVGGAEPILVTGDIFPGDFIVTSDVKGHGMRAKTKIFKLFNRNLTGKIIAQSLDEASGSSSLVRAFISKL